MSLLQEIQSAVLQDSPDLGPIFLKLRFLAARLGSQPLADWVRHESEGYPPQADLPDYRRIPVSYTASFSGAYGARFENAPIPLALIEQFAGAGWVSWEMRESIVAVNDLLSCDGGLRIDAADLILALEGKVYEGYHCTSVTGRIARSSLVAIHHVVCNRVLELTLELEKSVPDAVAITLGAAVLPSEASSAAATHVVQQIIMGNYVSISGAGNETTVEANVQADVESLVKSLTSVGITLEDSQALASLAASEKPESSTEPMGPKVQKWLGENLKKAASGVWTIGVVAATEVIKQALLKFYNLK